MTGDGLSSCAGVILQEKTNVNEQMTDYVSFVVEESVSLCCKCVKVGYNPQTTSDAKSQILLL